MVIGLTFRTQEVLSQRQHFGFEKEPIGSKRKAINIYFAFILQVLQVGKQFATAVFLYFSLI